MFFLLDRPLNLELVNQSFENAPWNCSPRGVSFALLQRGTFGKSLFCYNSSKRGKKELIGFPVARRSLLVSVDRIIYSADCSGSDYLQ